jgi:Transposase
MAKRAEKRERRSMVLQPDAAGIDIGAEEIFVAVPPDRDEESTRRFSSFTRDLHALADWLGRCRIQTVAMESAGVYWIPLFQILGERGFKVYLVNAHYLKSVPGRKSEIPLGQSRGSQSVECEQGHATLTTCSLIANLTRSEFVRNPNSFMIRYL